MINFRDRSEWGVSLVVLASLIAMAGTLAWMLLVPKPTTSGLAKERRDREFKVRLATTEARERLIDVQNAIDRRVWPGDPDNVAPSALDRVSRLARRENLKLVALRPQRAETVQGMTMMPFTVTVEGTFPKAMSFVKSLEAPEHRMAVTLIQINATDGSSDAVTLTLGLTTYAPIRKEEPVARG
ncbi:MAG TPA: GspMb/PilO family protein [Fimbriimonadaceae bacterium]|nr:GspMb/PilO family protein [Fimbriimonadaceae bacterium]